jgi:hypothetical protein
MEMATGMMDGTDTAAVTTLAKMVPKGGVIVDIGSLLGMSASLWCIHSEASRIVCIDLWKYESWLESFAKANGEISKEAFLRRVPDERVEAIQGSSPSCVSGWWRDPIDLYWDDADHANPGFASNLRFWSRHVKPGGVVCGHDYHWPDISGEAGILAAEWGTTVQRLGTSVWWIRKPELSSTAYHNSRFVIKTLPLRVERKLRFVLKTLPATGTRKLWAAIRPPLAAAYRKLRSILNA